MTRHFLDKAFGGKGRALGRYLSLEAAEKGGPGHSVGRLLRRQRPARGRVLRAFAAIDRGYRP